MLAGTRLGRYELVAVIGAGGMGIVYRAFDPQLSREVAVKVLAPDVAGDADRLRRFEHEARSAAALSHPNILSVFDVGADVDQPYIVSELLTGESLRGALARGPLPASVALDYGSQIAAGLAAAHRAGVVHRDLKPENLFVTTEGRVKILDFGLARAVAPTGETQTAVTEVGAVLGTVGYMSPEQVRGERTDPRTDLFSFGVVLFEMATGERPFSGNSPTAVSDAILHGEPRDFGNSATPGPLRQLIRGLLHKDPPKRISADEAHRQLSALSGSAATKGRTAFTLVTALAAGVSIVALLVVAGWLWHRSSRETWVIDTATPEIERLVDAGEYGKAAALAEHARAVMPDDPALRKLWTAATGEVAIESVPSGADVAIRGYGGDPNVWRPLGQTPLKNVRIARDVYVWRISRTGFASMVFIGQPPGGASILSRTVKLRPASSVPLDMVPVSGAPTVILQYPVHYGINLEPRVPVGDFLIDRHEVTNAEFKRFVDAGGYQRREFWTQSFVRDGHTVSWDEALRSFRDATGRPGPSTWEVGSFVAGTDTHPVAGVSWYEAAAYAEFVGKTLPTAYHWTLASQNPAYTPIISPGSNFRGAGTRPVGSESALSGSGTTDMAGNVKEWCLTEGRNGFRFILGGGYGEPEYMFNHTDQESPWERRANFGFRTVKLDGPPSPAALARVNVSPRDYRIEKSVSDDVFKQLLTPYAYAKSDLKVHVEEEQSAANWTREKVSFDAAYRHERVFAHVFLPAHGSPPFQTIVFFPAAGAFLKDSKLDFSRGEANDVIEFLLKSGRAVVYPIYRGSFERWDGYEVGTNAPPVFRQYVIDWAQDLGRTLDYLESRSDIDASKVGYFGASLGGVEAPIMAVVDTRIRVLISSSGGMQDRYDLPDVDPFNFQPRVRIPVLMISGQYDNTFPLETVQDPMFANLGTPEKDKLHKVYPGGHMVFPRPDAVRVCLDWLDKYLGPVRR
jgi:cephalosporin-C deacetylase-like acetyl esterase